MTPEQMKHFTERIFKGSTGVERFWKRVQKGGPDDCWPWHGAKSKDGYGEVGVACTSTHAHRVAYELTHGPVGKTYKICILHTCDNPPCCNPAHLFAGTRKDNVADMVNKGRMAGAIGARNCKVVLTEAQVLEIFASNESNVALGEAYDVAPTTISAIRNQRNWKHLTGHLPPKRRRKHSN
jgi:hypothetical protein